jgi:hypothetical protein
MPTKKTGHSNEEIKIKLTPAGISAERLAAIGRKVTTSAAVQKQLKGKHYRLLHVQAMEGAGASGEKSRTAAEPSCFRATFYDYTTNRVIEAEGRLTSPAKATVRESGGEPLPTPEEFQAAVERLRENADVGEALSHEKTIVYPAMPPLIEHPQLDGRNHRVLAVGILPRGGSTNHQIVGVDMNTGEVHRYPGNAPTTARAGGQICGVPVGAGQATTGQHTPGQVWVTVTEGGTTLWKFLVVRPSDSSGTRGSGVELRFVDYRGKRVLYRAHVPMLNVRYDQDACGPYRDWQYEEGMIQANGTDPAPGFRLCNAPATTILDTGSDVGNFLGTAIYVEGQEVVLACEMEAGWYRYVSMWRLHTNGTIKPRFGFSAVGSSCVCNVHHHHCYWRFDFDIRTPGNNRVREFNDPPLFPPSNWHEKHFEIRRPRDPARKRKWLVENSSTGEGYEIVPGATDGEAATSPDAPFGRGDVWLLRYHGNEIDDGVNHTGPPCEVNLDPWVNGESIYDQDVVVWYGAHFTHDVQHEPPGEHGHIVGPELRPVNW